MLEGREYSNSDAFPLAKLIYSLAGTIAVVDYVERFATEFWISRHIDWISRHSGAALDYEYLTTILVPLFTSVVVIFVYRPFSIIFGSAEPGTKGSSRLFRFVLYGIGGGLVAFALSIPFLLRGDNDGDFVVYAISNITSAKGLPMLLLLIVALPVAMEAVFRGITFRTLAIHGDVPSALVASSLLFALVWPAFGWLIGVILGAVSALLYHRTRSLVPSIVANGVLTLSGGIFILGRALMRH